MNIVCDCDDILRDFVPGVVEKYNEIYETKHTIEDIVEWDISKCLPKLGNIYDFMNNYRAELLILRHPIPKSLEVLDRLKENNNIIIATHQIQGLEGCTLSWLYKNNVKYDSIFFGKEKFLLQGDIIVDDNYDNVKKFVQANPGSKGFLMDKPWNRTQYLRENTKELNIERIHYLQQVLNYVNNMEK